MKNVITPLLLILASSAATAHISCATDVANRYYANHKYEPKKTDDVDLLFAAPKRQYDVIADFQSRNESPNSLRDKAAKIGADAIIVVTLGGYHGRDEEWAEPKNPNTVYTRIVGTAIKYK